MKLATLIGLLVLTASVALAQQPTTLRLADNERVLHFISSPFDHSYCEPRLETTLRRYYARRGLVYRRVTRSAVADFLRDLDGRLAGYRPTLVIVQASNADIQRQWRRKVFDFSKFPAALDALVKKLRDKGIKVILCSVIPVGPKTYELEPQYKRLSEWVEAARRTAAKHGAIFVDLYTKAVGWHMIGRPRAQLYYDVKHHRKSWDLFRSQVRFEPPLSQVRVNAKDGKATAEGASASEVKASAKSVSLVLQNDSGSPLLLRIDGLAAGNYGLTADRKSVSTHTDQELAVGVDVSKHFKSQAYKRPHVLLGRELHKKLSGIDAIIKYVPPGWVKVKDLEAQKRAAIDKVEAEAAKLEAEVMKMLTPKPLRISVVAK